jgi:hypothetical protein
VFPHIPEATVACRADLACPELVNIETIEMYFTLALDPLAGNATHSLSTMIEAAVSIKHDGLRFASISKHPLEKTMNGRLLLPIKVQI